MTSKGIMQLEVLMFLLAGVVTVCYGCTIDLMPGIRHADKDAHEADDTKMSYSDVVVVGKISAPVFGLDLPLENYDGMYSVTFEVLCVIKGGNLPGMLYVVGMGRLLRLSLFIIFFSYLFP